MSYLKINDVDFSRYVNALKIGKTANYNAQTNAAGDSLVDYINTKKVIEVGIIPLDTEAMITLQDAIDNFFVTITFLNTRNELEEINCIIPSENIEYYTIQVDKIMFKAFSLQFVEL